MRVPQTIEIVLRVQTATLDILEMSLGHGCHAWFGRDMLEDRNAPLGVFLGDSVDCFL